METRNNPVLVLNLGAADIKLPADDVHYLFQDGPLLRIGRTADDGPGQRLGHFVPMLGRWYFHADNVPAARVLRIDGGPVSNVRQKLDLDRPTSIGLLSSAPTGPFHPRTAPEGEAPRLPARIRDDKPSRGARRYVIGRTGTHADISIDDPLVRARHATVRVDGLGRWWISGELYVGGVRQMSATLSEGEVFVIGQTAVTVSAELLGGTARMPDPVAGVREVVPGARRPSTAETGLSVRLDGVTVYGHQNRKRLDNVTISIDPGQVVAVVGPSGAGKSSLIKVLMGELAEQQGTVQLGPGNGLRTDPELRRRQVRYVPQGDDGLFGTLTVRETLTYAARLRAAADTSAAEVKDRVAQVLDRLGLDQLGDHPVDDISGGQKRRVSIGTELVGDPQLLLLDEPTSGLDPGKDRDIMRSLREVAATYHCTVIIVTHATEHLGYVDKVITIGRGGRVRDAGPPGSVLATLRHPTWADLMVELDQDPKPGNQRNTPPPGITRTRSAPLLRWKLAGLPTLLHRQLMLTARRGRGTLAVLFLVPLICTGLAVAASGGGLRPSAAIGSVLSILVTVAALTGASLTYPDIVNDEGKLHRDFRVGVEALPIALSKAIVFTGVCAVLAGVVSVEFALLRDLPPDAYGLPPFGMLYAVVLLTMLASMGIGLFISACSPSLERAVTWSTLLAVLQVALSGTLFHLNGFLGIVTRILPARLGLAAMASYTGFNSYRGPALYTDALWNAGATRFWLLVFGLVLALAVAVWASVLVLHRRWTR
ncbi:ATP-binding cassette domain-containing protein [Winogradskya humida]|uniref:FHA modulated ABC efflux pump with fused ATPase and integral membrane subunit n=1 Tax=Winogradskya humida TaxID=113566 RepID=A0ABQ3ZTC1_9ACTN|nr:ATP-binding cassette domain-containing protein [Actinoplanes humidus]GIE21842.1 hypothetical protein Ahu01nite_049440 [Actinoplanes humidus]